MFLLFVPWSDWLYSIIKVKSKVLKDLQKMQSWKDVKKMQRETTIHAAGDKENRKYYIKQRRTELNTRI